MKQNKQNKPRKLKNINWTMEKLPDCHWINKDLYYKFDHYIWEQYLGEKLELNKNLFLG